MPCAWRPALPDFAGRLWQNTYCSLFHLIIFHIIHLNFEKQKGFDKVRRIITNILKRESELERIAMIVGISSLPDEERFVVEMAKIIKEEFLQQSAYDKREWYSSIKEQYDMMKLISNFYEKGMHGIKEKNKVDAVSLHKLRKNIRNIKFGN